MPQLTATALTNTLVFTYHRTENKIRKKKLRHRRLNQKYEVEYVAYIRSLVLLMRRTCEEVKALLTM